MKRFLLAAILVFATVAAFSQDDEYQKFLEQRKKQMKEKSEANQKKMQDMNQEYKDYVDKMNAEFADFVSKQWELFEEFKKDRIAYTEPKVSKAPVVDNPSVDDKVIIKESKEIEYKDEEELPKVTNALCMAFVRKNNDNYVMKTRLSKNGAIDLLSRDFLEDDDEDDTKVKKPEPEKQETEKLETEKREPEANETKKVETEQPKPEQPKTEQPKPEQPKPEQPKLEQPKPVQPEQPKPEQPKNEKSKPVVKGNAYDLNFYGRQVSLHASDKLKIHSSGVEEKNVADYFSNIAKNREETKALWDEVAGVVNEFGLNEWGYFCLLRSLSESMFTNINDRVLFCFYMLRNEGNFKTRLARGKESGKLTLLIALDNSKQVYSYSFFKFDDNENGSKKVKYYTVYGGGKAKEPVFSYSFCKQDASKKEMMLDFTKNLNMGACDMTRTVQLTKDRTITLPYNKAHVDYFNDVPMTVFPIYFANPVSIEAQQVLQNSFNEMKDEYTPAQFIQMLLHFVQTGFEYKTDDDQFGYEKYFYPEEVLGYPYCDCEDRSAMFAWLVQKYTSAEVIGLQYEGHVATAVWFGDGVQVKGDGFMYGGKKYYVCDPTYINASIGMAMPQYKGATPKIIKLR